MARKYDRRKFRKSLRLEHLETRQVFAGDLEVSPVETTLAAPFIFNPDMSGFGQRDQDFQTFDNQSDLQAKLESLVDQYWSHTWGTVVPQYPSFFYDDLFSGVRPESVVSVADLQTLSPVSRSITNTQYSTIDEADTVDMTDDGYLVTRRGNEVFLSDLRDPAHVTNTLLFSNQSYDTRLFVVGDRLITLLASSNYDITGGFQTIGSNTTVNIYDISDRAHANLQSTLKVDGALHAARLSNGLLTLVLDGSVTIPTPATVTDDQGISRYETKDAYLARYGAGLLTGLLANYEQNGVTGDVAQWDDVAIGSGELSIATTILRIDLQGAQPAVVGSEQLVGVRADLAYVGPDNIYITGGIYNGQTPIYRIDASSDGEVKATARATVTGTINSPRWMDEVDGVLRVATNGQGWTFVTPISGQVTPAPVNSDSTASIFTLGQTATGWGVLGELRDVAGGEQLLSAAFFGDVALLTTGILPTVQFFGHDPLHSIDLSNPSQPKEISELAIPGFSTYLQSVDATHWIGIGFDTSTENPFARALQVSLYEPSDLSNMRVVDRWSEATILDTSWVGINFDPSKVYFDQATGTLTLGQYTLSGSNNLVTPVFKIDVAAADPVQLLAELPQSETIIRNFVTQNALVTVTSTAVTTHSLSDLTQPLDQEFLGPQQFQYGFYWNVNAGSTTIQYVLNGLPAGYYRVESISGGPDLKFTIGDDGQAITVESQAKYGGSSTQIVATVRYFDGTVQTITGNLYVAGEPVPVTYSDAHASLGLRFQDESGNVTTELHKGDEVWVVVSVKDERSTGTGVFSAYVDVAFNSDNIETVGSLEHLSGFVNGAQGTIGNQGVSQVGGFRDGRQLSNEPQDLARFKIRITNDSPVTLTASINPAAPLGNEFLMMGENSALQSQNIASAALSTDASMPTVDGEFSGQSDVNGDGNVTALDVLQLVNYINALSDRASGDQRLMAMSASALEVSNTAGGYDFNNDGVVSAVDVLQVVNQINARLDAASATHGTVAGEGEAAASYHAAVDLAFAADWSLDAVVKHR